MSQVIHLGPWSLLESVERAMQIAETMAKKFGHTTSFPREAAEYVHDEYMPLVSLLLYLCSVNGEIGDGERRPTRPRPKKTKKGHRMFPPMKVSTWDVGVRMGAVLRRAKETVYRETHDYGREKQRSSPRPHVRRAHWHGYWTGPRDGERK